jgi:hypothetical protein
MTLICSFDWCGHPIVIGDVMVSVEGGESIASPLTLNHEALIKDIPRSTQALIQKVAILHSQVIFCWSNRYSNARRVAAFLEMGLRGTSGQVGDVKRLMSLVDPADLIGVSGFIICKDGAGFHHEYINIRPFKLASGRNYVACGSGAEIFDSWAVEIDQIAPSHRDVNEGIAIALTYVSRATIQQAIGGQGVLEQWGGGFEVAAYWNGAFRKVDKVFLHYIGYEFSPDGRSRPTKLVYSDDRAIQGMELWQLYLDDALYINPFINDGVFGVSPLLDEDQHYPTIVDVPFVDVEWLVTGAVHIPTMKLGVGVRHRPVPKSSWYASRDGMWITSRAVEMISHLGVYVPAGMREPYPEPDVQRKVKLIPEAHLRDWAVFTYDLQKPHPSHLDGSDDESLVCGTCAYVLAVGCSLARFSQFRSYSETDSSMKDTAGVYLKCPSCNSHNRHPLSGSMALSKLTNTLSEPRLVCFIGEFKTGLASK